MNQKTNQTPETFRVVNDSSEKLRNGYKPPSNEARPAPPAKPPSKQK